MGERKEGRGGEKDKELYRQLRSLEGKKVELQVKEGASKYGRNFRGKLIDVNTNPITKRQWVSIDFGMTGTFYIDQIESVKAVK